MKQIRERGKSRPKRIQTRTVLIRYVNIIVPKSLLRLRVVHSHLDEIKHDLCFGRISHDRTA